MKIKVIIGVITLASILVGFGFKGYNVFAKEAEFQEFKTTYNYDQDQKKFIFYSQEVAKCKAKYGEHFERASESEQGTCVWFQGQKEIILKRLKKGS